MSFIRYKLVVFSLQAFWYFCVSELKTHFIRLKTVSCFSGCFSQGAKNRQKIALTSNMTALTSKVTFLTSNVTPVTFKVTAYTSNVTSLISNVTRVTSNETAVL